MGSQKLQVGQLIELREYSHGFEYAVLPPGGAGQEVLEVGPDYVVVKGEDPVTWVRYPCYLLRERPTAATAALASTPPAEAA
jgi:hypothetical protein